MPMACAAGVGMLTERPTSVYALCGGTWRLWATLLWIGHTIAGYGDVAAAWRGLRVSRRCHADRCRGDRCGYENCPEKHAPYPFVRRSTGSSLGACRGSHIGNCEIPLRLLAQSRHGLRHEALTAVHTGIRKSFPWNQMRAVERQ